ncbi:MAG: hypothetical protein L6R39_003356 [Caloplaca ligustica]|nr:MAG: hypothetical protein L6R39_003356 [Caloplaca ligustica]
MHSYVQVITTPTVDTPGAAMLLDVGQKRYLFGNIHEGLQRACIQRKSRLAKTTEIFITGKTEWKNIGGLFGVILTLADANASAIQSERENAEKKRKKEEEDSKETPKSSAAKAERRALHEAERAKIFLEAGLNPEEWVGGPDKSTQAPTSMPTLTIHGGKNLTHTIATARQFIFRKGMPIQVDEYTHTQPPQAAQAPQVPASPGDGREPDWTDDAIQVWKLPIDPANGHRSPGSHRKRSFGEFAAGAMPSVQHEHNMENPLHRSEASAARDDEQRRFVVSEMFNSQWMFDALTERPLDQVPYGTRMWIRNEETHKLELYWPPRDGLLPQLNVLIRDPWPGALVKQLPPTQTSQIAMSYIVRHYPQRGKFDPTKAKALNVHHMIFHAIQRGATVRSRHGVTVTPDMVLEPSRPGGGFAMIDIPTLDYAEALLSRPEWRMPRIMDGLQAIFWNVGPGVATALQSFFNQHQAIMHIIMAPDVSPNHISFDSSTALVIRLNQLDPERYPIPLYQNYVNLQPLIRHINADYRTPEIATRGLQFQMEPSLHIQAQQNHDAFLDTATVLKQMPKEVLEFAQNAKSDVANGLLAEEPASQNLPSPDAEITCLGTGSSAPSKYRNVSATLLRVPGCGSYLFDCGEGTLGQLRRLYTPSELDEVLLDLKAIWISHLHADHHLGTTSVIKAWHQASHVLGTAQAEIDPSDEKLKGPIKTLQEGKKLFLFAGERMIRWLKEYSSVENFGYNKIVAIRVNRAEKNPNFSDMGWNDVQVGFRTDDAAMLVPNAQSLIHFAKMCLLGTMQ